MVDPFRINTGVTTDFLDCGKYSSEVLAGPPQPGHLVVWDPRQPVRDLPQRPLFPRENPQWTPGTRVREAPPEWWTNMYWICGRQTFPTERMPEAQVFRAGGL